jgi:hypothetical protein
MSNEPKQAWQKPELVVLLRSQPEEAVLVICKRPSAGVGPTKQNCKTQANTPCNIQTAS